MNDWADHGNVPYSVWMSNNSFREALNNTVKSMVFYQTGGGGWAKGGKRTKPLMIIFVLLELIETPRHPNHVDMLKNNHISLTIVVKKAYKLGPGS